MAPFTFTLTAKAPPSIVWKTCLLEPKLFEEWDPDVKEILGTEPGVPSKDGMEIVFHMNDGLKIPMTLSNVVENKSLTFGGSAMGGVIKFQGDVVMKSVADDSTEITYTFGLTGCLGGVMSVVGRKAVEGGTKGGIDNMVKLSEEAAKAS